MCSLMLMGLVNFVRKNILSKKLDTLSPLIKLHVSALVHINIMNS